MKRTVLTDRHIALGAKMVPFAGYQMPVQYAGINAEHEAVRTGAGVFDVSHMGEFLIRGEGALDLIQRVSSNDAAKLADGKVQYACLPNEAGGIVDDLLIYRIDELTYMLVVNASNIKKDWNWICRFNHDRVDMEDISDRTSLLAVQGPKAAEALKPLTGLDLDMTYYTFRKGKIADIEVLVSATGYTGAGGFELYVPNESAEELWDALLAAGVQPIGLGARDTLRLEMGYCLYGNDIDDTTSPLEAGLGWVCKDKAGFGHPTRKLVGFEMNGRAIPRKGYLIVDVHGHIIGAVTSGSQSPSLQKGIGLGYVDLAHAGTGEIIYVLIREQAAAATIVKLPFYRSHV